MNCIPIQRENGWQCAACLHGPRPRRFAMVCSASIGDQAAAAVGLAYFEKKYIAHGPGTELMKLLGSINVHAIDQCNCADKAQKMNEWGVEGCREHFATIVEWLKEGAKSFAWPIAIGAACRVATSCLAFHIDPLRPFESLVEESIRREEKRREVDR